jgi:hypothetical protein
MADTPRDKRANALERIRALKEGRAANKTGAPGSGGSGGSKAPKNAPRHASTGHRPQGG